MRGDTGCITLAVLAGGAGARMGFAKDQLVVGGRAILEYLSGRWKWTGPTMVITSPARPKVIGGECFGRQIPDAVAGQGPLRGILTAVEASETEVVIVTTVDMPNITRGHLEWLGAALGEGMLGVVTRPLPGVFRKGAGKIIRARLEAGEPAVHALEAVAGFARVEPDWGPEAWVNLNRPEDQDHYEGTKTRRRRRDG